ncbi:MAG: fasciclin domain-containing protein [Gemmatimonadaceae bacterium]
MKRMLSAVALASALVTATGVVASAQTVNVGGQAMFVTKDIIDNAVKSADHTTLVAAVKAAGLVETLKGKGPFTVFAPVNDAFRDLPAGTVDNLLKPENKSALTGVLTYHVVPGAWTASVLEKAIKKGGGKTMLKTANGGLLTASMNGPRNIVITDSNGGAAHISTYDVLQSNGVIQVIDRVLLPKM